VLEADARKLKDALQLAWEWQEGNRGQFIGEVEAMHLSLVEEISGIQLLADDAVLMRASEETADIDMCVSMLCDIREQVAALEEEAQRVNAYQCALRRPPSEFPTLEAMSKVVELKLTVWEALREADELYHARADGLGLAGVDAAAEEERAVQWVRVAQRAEKTLHYSNMDRAAKNTLPDHLKRKAAAHRELVRVCEHLVNPALTGRHWAAAAAMTGGQWAKVLGSAARDESEEELSFGLVLRLKVMDHRDVLEQVCVRVYVCMCVCVCVCALNMPNVPEVGRSSGAFSNVPGECVRD
jgi:hypothetical protein